MQGYRPPGSTQRFLTIHADLYSHVNTRSHLIPASEHRALRPQAIKIWNEVVGATA
jgi:hypothetical protein